MDRKPWLISVVLAGVFLALYLSGLPEVPFHPDESSWLFMSRDFAAVIRQVAPAASNAKVWSPSNSDGGEQYRLLNAPLPKYLMGLSWWLGGFTPDGLNTDWAWPQTWDENVAAGHLPSPSLLWAGRLPGAVLSALAAALMFWIVYDVRGLGTGLAAGLMLGLNPLVLLHGRRAMAEGALLFFSLLAVWGVARLARAVGESRRTLTLWLLALGVGGLVGLAVCSKQSALALGPAAAAAVMLPLLRPATQASLRRRLALLAGTWLALVLGCALTFWALNPILYRDPVGGLRAMITARVELARQQTETQAALSPETVTPEPLSRLRAALLEVYLRPPAVWDVPVYLDKLSVQADAYFAQPLQRIAGGWGWGVLMVGLGAAGLGFSFLRLWHDRLGPVTRSEQTLWWWALATLSLTLLTTPFDWQRYFIPLVPLACLFAAFGLEMLVRPLPRLIAKLAA